MLRVYILGFKILLVNLWGVQLWP